MPLAPGSPAPRFTLPAAAGGVVGIPDPEGRPAVLAFFKDDCPTCRLTFPFLQRLHAQAGERALVAGISQDDAPRAAAWAGELGLTFPIGVDATGYPVSDAYALRSVPTLYLVDAAGRIVRAEEGFRRDALGELAAGLAALAGTKPPALFLPGEAVPALKPG